MAMTPFLANQLGCDVISSTSTPEINTLNVFPNPANEYVQVVNGSVISSVQIIDLHGKLVQSAQSNAAISTKELSNGLYFIRVQNVDGTSRFTRLLVQHD
jgi:PIN domain nuclease of toxin-antitoxin system